jgi:hypothetical protein
MKTKSMPFERSDSADQTGYTHANAAPSSLSRQAAESTIADNRPLATIQNKMNQTFRESPKTVQLGLWEQLLGKSDKKENEEQEQELHKQNNAKRVQLKAEIQKQDEAYKKSKHPTASGFLSLSSRPNSESEKLLMLELKTILERQIDVSKKLGRGGEEYLKAKNEASFSAMRDWEKTAGAGSAAAKRK